MKDQDQIIALVEFDGFTGCADAECFYRKCQHLHKGKQAFFPEPYSTSRYPNYIEDLNAVHELEKKLVKLGLWRPYLLRLIKTICSDADEPINTDTETVWGIVHATARQRCEALLKTLGKWKD